jgi:hypothetical protein
VLYLPTLRQTAQSSKLWIQCGPLLTQCRPRLPVDDLRFHDLQGFFKKGNLIDAHQLDQKDRSTLEGHRGLVTIRLGPTGLKEYR